MNANLNVDQLKVVLDGFALDGTLLEITAFGTGHINNTYRSIYDEEGTKVRYTHQRINEQVFKHPEEVMDNIDRILAHLRAKILAARLSDPDRRCLRLIKGRTGKPWVRDHAGGYWRTYAFIEKSSTCEVLESPRQAENIARAVGRFQLMLADLGGKRLYETIPNFHNTPERYKSFHQVLEADPVGRAASVRREIDWVLANEERACAIAGAMASGSVPERITHNDTKANNILLDEASGEAICVIDLDTVMPGSLLFDFGDLVRTSTGTAAEDEADASRMEMRLPFFQPLAKGFIGETAAILTSGERDLLPEAGRSITVEQALRFLGDHIAGDTYYRIHRPGQNLDRARTQIALVNSMDRQMDGIVRACHEALPGVAAHETGASGTIAGLAARRDTV